MTMAEYLRSARTTTATEARKIEIVASSRWLSSTEKAAILKGSQK